MKEMLHDSTKKYNCRIYKDIRVPSKEKGLSISVDIYLPAELEKAPAIVSVLPYRKDIGSEISRTLGWFAERGYACVIADHFGIGSSDGKPHPPWSKGEAQDAITVTNWTATQPWCDGNIGLWGHSHGGFTSMAAVASHEVPWVKAIMPIEAGVNVERDFVHFEGNRSDLAPFFRWGAPQLLQQLMPPISNSAVEHKRWLHRINEIDPFFLDFAANGPGNAQWRERAVDLTAVQVPTFCIGGWRDVNCVATIRAFETIDAPKRLLMGPWMHSLPDAATFASIDFLLLAKRWWDHWLHGVDNGVMDEAPVCIFIQGDSSEWREYSTWPPDSQPLELGTFSGPNLGQPTFGDAFSSIPIEEKVTDPTIGVLSGLQGLATINVGFPVDQHDDDMRSIAITSDLLPEDLLIVGRPEVSMKIATAGGFSAAVPDRIVVRLTEVDSDGRSIQISSGVLPGRSEVQTHNVSLAPTAYRVAAGKRLRLVFSGSDFPRLNPIPYRHVVRLFGAVLSVPMVKENTGAAAEMPRPEAAPKVLGETWRITRNIANEETVVEIAMERSPRQPTQDGIVGLRHLVSAEVSRRAPQKATTKSWHTALMQNADGDDIEVNVIFCGTITSLEAEGEIKINQDLTFRRHWRVPLWENSEIEPVP